MTYVNKSYIENQINYKVSALKELQINFSEVLNPAMRSLILC